MKSAIIKIGRHPIYPYFCILSVTIAFLLTDPFKEFTWRYTCSYIGAITGLLCVILLAKGKNSGNIFGIVAGVGESSANFLGGNIGAALPPYYNIATHIYALPTWKKHQDNQNTVITRILNESHFIMILLFFVVAMFISTYLTKTYDNTLIEKPYQLLLNGLIFALCVVAQFLLIQRFSINWYVWIIANILIISLNIYTNNPIIATQYCIYIFNAIYGLIEWKSRQQSETSKL